MHIHIYIVEFFFETLSQDRNEFFSYMIVTFIENLIVNSINFLFNFFTENFL